MHKTALVKFVISIAMKIPKIILQHPRSEQLIEAMTWRTYCKF